MNYEQMPVLRRTRAADELAAEFLDEYARDADGKLILPIDPGAIATSLGVSVHDADLPDGISGVLMKKGNQPTVIMLNKADAPVRRRFTCAHELGHYAERLESGAAGSEFTFVDRRDGASSSGDEPREVFANKFAAALLMPPYELAELVDSLSVFQLATRFGVSADAMSFRLKNLGMIAGS